MIEIKKSSLVYRLSISSDSHQNLKTGHPLFNDFIKKAVELGNKKKFDKENISNTKRITVFGGVNVIESDEILFQVAEEFSKLSEKLNFNYVFKASFDKANRSSLDSYRGPGIEKGLESLEKVKQRFDLPIITDIHEPKQAEIVAEVCEILQIQHFYADRPI